MTRNSGSWNSGSWNSGSCNSGYLNTTKAPIRIFDKTTNKEKENIIFPQFFYFELDEWIYAENMTEEEQKAHPSWQVTRGYLKRHTYKEAWHKSFDNAKKSSNWESEKQKLLSLPNFDFDKFEQISGITRKDIEE